MGAAMTVTRTYRFHEVFEEEIQAVNQRRRRFGRAEVALELEPDVSSQSNARAEGEPMSISASQLVMSNERQSPQMSNNSPNTHSAISVAPK